MPSRFYTHTATVLFDRAPTFDEVHGILPHASARTIRSEIVSPWFGDRDLLVTIDAERNGKLAIDVTRQPWPDTMGDPKTDAPLFGAWTFGSFGATTYPGGLARACEQAWMARDVAALVPTHVAFVRFRTTYVIGGGDDAPIVPEGHAHARDIDAITSHAITVLGLPGAIGYFDPEGEVLLSASELDATITFAREHDRPPIEATTNVRMYDVDAERSLIDTVGMARFGLPDLEIPFARSFDPNDIVRFARNILLYQLGRGAPIPSGDTLDGPGGSYRVFGSEESHVAPPRRVLRLLIA